MEIASKACKLDVSLRNIPARASEGILREAFERIQGPLFVFVLRRVGGDRNAAEELLQQTCFEAARGRAPIVKSETAAWMFGIARNLIRRHWRALKKRSREISLEDAATAATLAEDMESRPLPLETMLREETLAMLRTALARLPDSDRELIVGHFFEGRTQTALAHEAGISEKCVESRLYRARGRLRKALRKMERSGGA